VVWNLGGGLAGIAKVRVVRFWSHPDGAPLPNEDGFSGWGDDDVAPSPEQARPAHFDPLGNLSAGLQGGGGPPRSGATGAPPGLLAIAMHLGRSSTLRCRSGLSLLALSLRSATPCCWLAPTDHDP